MPSPFKGILDHFMPIHGGAVTVYRNYGTAQQTEKIIAKALKNTKTKHGGGHVFQFTNREDILEGDVVQQKGSNDLWLVTDTNDFMDGEDFIYFEADVEKATKTGTSRPKSVAGHTVHIGSVVGGVQVGTTDSSQNVSVTMNPEVSANIAQLRKFVSESELDGLDKDEIQHELNRVEDLAKKPDEPKAKAKLSERLAVVEKMVSVSEKLARIAFPLITAIAGHFS